MNTSQNETPRLFGAHMPTAGGLHRSLLAGKGIGCNAIQLFTANPRQWNAPPLEAEDVAAFLAAREETGMDLVVAHDSYLINLAAPAPEVLERSQLAFRGELDRAEALDIAWVVTHMGAHLKQGETEAVARLAVSLRQILDATDAAGYRVGIALETTAGQGTGLGWRFEQIGEVLAQVGAHPRLGVCLDTCHIFVAGYDLRDETTYEQTWAEFERYIGRDRLKVIHANDAKKPLGSRVDRHEHIGTGEIGEAAFVRLARDTRLAHLPFLIETPDAETMHGVNLRRLQRLAAGGTLAMTISVYLFGHYSDYCDAQPLELRLPDTARVADVAQALAQRDPRLVDLERHCRFAVEEEYATLETELRDGSTVAVLPPMSGG